MILEAIKKMVNSNHNKPLDVLIAEKTQEIKKTLDGGMQVPVIKSVQNGYASLSMTGNTTGTLEIVISSVNPEKAFFTEHFLDASKNGPGRVRGYSIENNKLKIKYDTSRQYVMTSTL